VLTKVRFVDRDERILPEMSAKVAFLEKAMADGERQPLIAVHKDALAADGKHLFLIESGRVKQLAVTAGRKINDLVEIATVPPLAPGAKVVARPGERLGDGAKVKVVSK